MSAPKAAGLTGAAPITSLGKVSIGTGLGSSLAPAPNLSLSGSLSAAAVPTTLGPSPLPAVRKSVPPAPAGLPIPQVKAQAVFLSQEGAATIPAAVRVGMLAEAAAPHIEAALDAKSGAETSRDAAAAVMEPFIKSEGAVAAEAAPAQEPLVKDVSFDDGVPAYGGTTKHQRELLLESLRQRPEAWEAEFSRLGIDLSRGEPRFRVLRTDLQLMGKENGTKQADYFADLAYNIELRTKDRRHSRVRVLLNPVSGELRAFRGGTQRSEPVLRRLSFNSGVSLEERALLNESLRRRKTAWSRGLAAARFSLLGRQPSIKVVSVATHQDEVRTYLIRWQRGDRKPRLMVVAIRPGGLTPRIFQAPPKR
jgi:hypothetical protein